MVATGQRRLGALVALALTIAAGLIAVSQPDYAVTDVVSDALYVVAVYAGLVIVIPRVSSFVVGAARRIVLRAGRSPRSIDS